VRRTCRRILNKLIVVVVIVVALNREKRGKESREEHSFNYSHVFSQKKMDAICDDTLVVLDYPGDDVFDVGIVDRLRLYHVALAEFGRTSSALVDVCQ
jgi:hypothetical protein